MRPIDADAMLDRLEEWNTDDPIDKALYNFAWNRIIEQPTIESEQRWIPVGERLPEKSGQYYVSGKSKVWICEFLTIHSGTKLLGGWCNNAANPVVQAWMPLPEPYKGGEQNDDNGAYRIIEKE